MSYTVQRPRTSTSPRGYYNFDQALTTTKRGRSIKIVTDITQSPTSSTSSLSRYATVPLAPEPPSPNYARRRSPSFTRERRVVQANIVTRSPDFYSETPTGYSNDTQGELGRYYKRQVQASREPQRLIEVARPARPSSHRTKSTHVQQPERYELALVPVQHRDRAIIVERAPAARPAPVVVEKKQTIMIRDDEGRWYKARRVVR